MMCANYSNFRIFISVRNPNTNGAHEQVKGDGNTSLTLMCTENVGNVHVINFDTLNFRLSTNIGCFAFSCSSILKHRNQ